MTLKNTSLFFLCLQQGIITNIRQTKDGFYLQQAIPDGDLKTSDAIIVYTGKGANFTAITNKVKVGDTILIHNALATEFRYSSSPSDNTLTQLTVVPEVVYLLRAKPANAVITDLITPRIIGDENTPNRISYHGREFGLDVPQIRLDQITTTPVDITYV
jgi:co-chaperonin GroES (HSP10)